MTKQSQRDNRQSAQLSRGAKITRWCAWGIGEAFCIATVVYLCVTKDFSKLSGCFFSMALLFVAFLATKLFRFELNDVFFVFVEFYAITPVFGHAYKFYYDVFWWDSFMHLTGGVVFAIFGVFFAKWLNKGGKSNLLMRAIFALCFSMSVAVAWEFVEYASDTFFHSDMQKDTYVDTFYSYLLGDQSDELGALKDIDSVVVNGEPLKGYIDIGLIDTMSDLLIETTGAVIFTIWFLIDKDKHPLLLPHEKRSENAIEVEEEAEVCRE